LLRIYISKFGKIFRFLGPTPPPLHQWGDIWLLHAKYHPHQCSIMSPMWGEKPKNRPPRTKLYIRAGKNLGF